MTSRSTSQYVVHLGALALVHALVLAGVALAEDQRAGRRTVVALLVDGLNEEMIAHFETPNLDRLRREGAWSHDFVPTFPSISGPTWVSVSTGCWPAHHGVVTDKFWDPELGLMDHSTNPKWLSACELLQQVAERQGVKTAALGWWGQWSRESGPTATYVSSNASVEQAVPRDVTEYLSDGERAKEVARYLSMPSEERPHLILGFLRGPDHAAHFDGLFSEGHRLAMRDCDDAIGEILDVIDGLPNREDFAVFVFSDHGSVPVHHIVNVRRILARHQIDARDVTTGTTGFLYFQDSSEVARARGILAAYSEFEVLRKDLLPGYAQLGQGGRVADLIISAKPGYYTADPDLWPWYLRLLTVFGPDFVPSPLLGAGISAGHGYPPGVEGNHGVFYAWGSGVRRDTALGSVRMIDVHPTITSMLGIEPGSPVDGSSILALRVGRELGDSDMQPRPPEAEARGDAQVPFSEGADWPTGRVRATASRP